MIPLGYSRNVISGHLPGGESFQMSVWANEAPSDEAATQAQADAFASDFSTKLAGTGSPTSFLGSAGGYDKITVYSYLDNTGKATFGAESNITGGTGGTTQALPDQVALVITLLTGYSGRRNRGRIYMPMQASTITNGQISTTNVDNISAWWKGLFDAWNAHLGTQKLVVLSQIRGDGKPIVSLEVDSKLDIQRRRADKVVPAYSKSQVLA